MVTTYAQATAAFQKMALALSMPVPSRASAVGEPKEKIRIEPVTEPVPEKTPAPAPVEVPADVPEKVPA